MFDGSGLCERGESLAGIVTCCSLTGAFAVGGADLEVELPIVSKWNDGSACELRLDPPDLLLLGASCSMNLPLRESSLTDCERTA